ncbi:MAG TPA: hypothetical protein VFK13_02135 [Gemmatimonadaceae bacterium]|nr:hypothetical protein [Gemmatimonadaceae bacterium]
MLLGACRSASHNQRSSALPEWSLSPTATLRIGTEGDTTTEFLQIRGAVRMPSGNIVVADGGTQQLRVFTPDGHFVRSLSRRGGGPGELQSVARLQRVGDTLLSVDQVFMTPSVNVYTDAAGFSARITLRPDNAPLGLGALQRLASGALLVESQPFKAMTAVTPGNAWRDTVTLGVLHLSDTPHVSWLPPREGYSIHAYRDPALPGGGSSLLNTLSPKLVYGVAGDRIWIGDSGTGDIELVDSSGVTRSYVRLPVARRPFSKDALQRAEQRALAAADSPQRLSIRALYEEAPRPEQVPLFTSFVPGPDSEMWIILFNEDGGAPQAVIVCDSAGRAIARATIPAHTRLTDVGSRYVLGVETDELGVERVVQYALTR